jgi:hypothetical protein
VETLNTLAEVAIALAGFSSVVVLFRRRSDGRWDGAEANRFRGMIVHALHAAGFAFVPQILHYFLPGDAMVWAVSSLMLGVSTLLHVSIAGRLELATSRSGAFIVLISGLTIFLLQLANLFSWLGPPGPGLFLVGIFWHTAQAGFLFFVLVGVRPGPA